MSLDGRIALLRFHGATGWTAEGWAFDRRDQAIRPFVEVADRNGPLTRGVATMPPPSDTNGFGHGFALPLPGAWTPGGEPETLRLTLSSGGRSNRIDCVVPLQPVFGWIDAPRGFVVDGWAANGLAKTRPLVLDMLLDGRLVDRVVAEHHRDDLAPLGLSTHGFRWILPEAFLDGRPRQLTIRPTNARRFVPCPAVTVAQARHRLSGVARKGYLQRRTALAQSSGLGLARPIEPPSDIAARTAAATDVQLRRFDSRPWPVGAPPPEPSGRGIRPSFQERAALTLADQPIRGGVIAVRSGLLLGWLDMPGDGEAPVDLLANGRLLDRVVARRAGPDGLLAFAAALPPSCFDGCPNDFAACLSNSANPLPDRLSGLVLTAAEADAEADRWYRRREAGRQRLRTAEEGLLSCHDIPPERPVIPLILPDGPETVWPISPDLRADPEGPWRPAPPAGPWKPETLP